MNRLRLIKTAYTALACLMLTACASDELADGTVQDLPEGKYPLQISSVTMSAESTAEPWGANVPQTRVSEEEDDSDKWSKWQPGDEGITVKLSSTMADNEPYTVIGKYKINDDGTNLNPVSGNELYWHSTKSGTVTAWYCNLAADSGDTVNLSDQRNGLAYVLRAQVDNQSYNTPQVSLAFNHQLAKVRVNLTGNKATSVTSVKVKGYTSCTVTEGKISGSSTEGYISMKKPGTSDGYWEANVVPGTINNTAFLKVNGNDVNVTTTNNDLALQAGYYYIFNVTVE